MDLLIAEIENLILKRGGKQLQDAISLDWKAGRQWCVTGPTGSGKTSFLKTLAGILFMPGAKIKFPQLEVRKEESGYRKSISDYMAYVPQEVKIPSEFIQDLYYQRRYQAAEQEGIQTTREILLQAADGNSTAAEEAAEKMNLTRLLDQTFVQLSNGQSRRLMIALALIKKPEILLLDNPYTGLDHKARASLNRQLELLIADGIHLFMAAHEHELKNVGFITDTLTLRPVHSPKGVGNLPGFYKEHNPDRSLPVIRCENIKLAYGKRTILNIPFWQVNAGEHWLIRGDNGSGKSSLLALIIADHPQAYSNNITVFGQRRGSGESIWEIKRRMGYFSSELLRYYSKLPTTEEVIASGWSDFTGQIKSLTDDQKTYVSKLADWLDISFLLPVRIGELSLGQQKMVLIARAMIRNPEVLILDEPLQGMDAEWREHFKLKIAQFAQNRTMLYVTHDEEEIPPGNWRDLQL